MLFQGFLAQAAHLLLIARIGETRLPAALIDQDLESLCECIFDR
jgi:hypothetical protein